MSQSQIHNLWVGIQLAISVVAPTCSVASICASWLPSRGHIRERKGVPCKSGKGAELAQSLHAHNLKGMKKSQISRNFC